jgi:replication factor A2
VIVHTPVLRREAVEFLTNEGHLYSTIDDDHFKATG